MKPLQLGLRAKLMVVIGGITALLMMIISIGILFIWRNLIIEDQRRSASAVTQSVSIPVVDAFLRIDEDSPQVEDMLERLIDNFMHTLEGVRFIAVQGNDGRVLAHSEIIKYNQILRDSLSISIIHIAKPATLMYESPEHGWILEAAHPLQIAGKRWGTLRIGFDAQPLHRQIQLMFLLLAASTAVVTAASLLVLFLMIGRITNSLRRLVTLMDQTDLESPASPSSSSKDDEVGFLLHHFDLLRQRLAQSKSELVSVQQQIYQAEKLASIGRLASGVAHEINNPLNGIKSALYSIQREPENLAQTRKYFKLIDEGVNYIQVVVQKLLGFARQQSTAMNTVNINEVISNVVMLLDYKFKQKSAEVVLTLDPDLPALRADAQLISEVMMNLVINSCDALQPEGRIEIETSHESVRSATVIVRDNGIGIPEEHMKKIFDPFFTTKGPKEGTGLGLSVSLGIIQTHGGSIVVASEPGVKTEFTITLPLRMTHEHSPR